MHAHGHIDTPHPMPWSCGNIMLQHNHENFMPPYINITHNTFFNVTKLPLDRQFSKKIDLLVPPFLKIFVYGQAPVVSTWHQNLAMILCLGPLFLIEMDLYRLISRREIIHLLRIPKDVVP